MKKLLFILVAAIAVTACAEKKADRAEAKAFKADAAYCSDLAGLANAIAAYTTLDSTTTVADLKQATAAVNAAYAKVEQATTTMDKDEAKAVVAAQGAYNSAVNGISASTTLGSAAAQVQAAYTAYQERVADLNSAVCTITAQ